MTKEFQFDFGGLNVQSAEIEVLLGFENGDVPEPFPELIAQAIDRAPQLCGIKAGYQVFDNIQVITDTKTIKINDTVFSPSKTVTTQFREAQSMAVFVCTAGAGITDFSKEISLQDPVLGYVYDVLGSVTVDKAACKMQDALKTEVAKNGLNISDSFSPGYCEWSVAEQQKLFALLPANFCGIKLSASSLMAPTKSVSGMIAIGKNLQQKGYQCNWCTDRNCIYGKIRRQKRFEKNT